MLVYATFCWANRGTQRDRPVSRRLHSVHGRAHDCLGRALFGGEFADRLAQSRRPHGSAGSHHARGVWPDLRYKLSRSGSLTLAGAERMLVFPCSDLTCACLPPVPQWAVRTSLDTLGLSRFSHWACPDGFRGACLSSLCTDWPAHHTRVFERVGDHCDRPNLPLPAPFQSASTAADKMGGLRHCCIDYRRCERDCADLDFPDGSFVWFTLSCGSQCVRHHGAARHSTLVWVRHTARTAVGHRCAHQSYAGLCYADGLIFVLQYLLRGIISQNNDVVIVVSTLAIAALFQPLRQRIQQIIDRRFYRRKYNAAKIVDAFSATLRNEVDLNQLREHLITVVQDTMQPTHVSLWLREPASKFPPPDRKQS